MAAGIPARILAAWRAGQFEIVVSPALLAEYEEILSRARIRRRHGMTYAEVRAEVGAIAQVAQLVEPESMPSMIPADPDDDQMLATAVAGVADYIVSGDRHLLELREYEGVRILSPAAFATLLS